RELGRHDDADLGDEVAVLAPRRLEPLAAQPDLAPRGRAGGNLDPHVAVQGRERRLASQRGLPGRHVDRRAEVRPFHLEPGVGDDLALEEEVAGLAAPAAAALAGEPDLLPGADAGGDLDREVLPLAGLGVGERNLARPAVERLLDR